MPVIGVQIVVAAATATAIRLIVVPAILWGLSVWAGVLRRKSRLFTFRAAFVVGFFGLLIGIGGLTSTVPENALPAQALGAVAGILGGALLLVIGALLGFVALFLPRRRWANYEPPEAIHYHTRWQSPGASGDSGGWVRGPDFYNFNAARRWAQRSARLQGVSVVEIYTEESTGAKVVETIQASIDTDP